MQTWIALMRGVNVGGHRKLAMAALRETLTGLGLENVETYIQSGNAVFRTKGDAAALARQIAAAIEGDFGFAADVLVMPARDMADAIAANPFPQAEDAPTTLHLFFLMAPAVDFDAGAMQDAATMGEDFALDGRVFYFHAPNGMGRSDLGHKLGRFIGAPMTGRNLRSCHRILDLARKAGEP